jgi:hypothetical protein
MSDQSDQTRAIESGHQAAAPASPARGRRRFGRRALMLGAAATGAGVAASIAGGAGAEAAPDASGAVQLGKSNSTKSTTQVLTKGGDALKGQTSATNHSGIVGFDVSSSFGGHGVYGHSIHGVAVLGISQHHTGIVGQTTTVGQSGVAGIDMTPGAGAHALFGQSSKGDAVFGTTENGNALHGTSAKGNALLVEGKARFSTSGVTNVPAHQMSVTISNGHCTPTSIVLATIQKPQGGISIEAAEPGSGSFTITLTGSPSSSVPIGWLILDH